MVNLVACEARDRYVAARARSALCTGTYCALRRTKPHTAATVPDLPVLTFGGRR